MWLIVLSIFLIIVFIGGYKVLNISIMNPKNIVNNTKKNLIVDEYKNSIVKDFKNSILKKYPNIKSVSIDSQQVNVHFEYTVKNDLNKDECDKIFEETKMYLRKDSFQKSIMKEANRQSFFSYIGIACRNPKTKYNMLYMTNKFGLNQADNSIWKFYNLGT